MGKPGNSKNVPSPTNNSSSLTKEQQKQISDLKDEFRNRGAHVFSSYDEFEKAMDETEGGLYDDNKPVVIVNDDGTVSVDIQSDSTNTLSALKKMRKQFNGTNEIDKNTASVLDDFIDNASPESRKWTKELAADKYKAEVGENAPSFSQAMKGPDSYGVFTHDGGYLSQSLNGYARYGKKTYYLENVPKNAKRDNGAFQGQNVLEVLGKQAGLIPGGVAGNMDGYGNLRTDYFTRKAREAFDRENPFNRAGRYGESTNAGVEESDTGTYFFYRTSLF